MWIVHIDRGTIQLPPSKIKIRKLTSHSTFADWLNLRRDFETLQDWLKHSNHKIGCDCNDKDVIKDKYIKQRADN